MTETESKQLVEDLRACAETLSKLASEESAVKTASINSPVASSRVEYMNGIMSGLGLED